MHRDDEAPTQGVPEDGVESQIWDLLDGRLSPGEIAQLEQTLASDEEARACYVECLRLHCDLADYFRPRDQQAKESPVLAHLLATIPFSPGKMPRL